MAKATWVPPASIGNETISCAPTRSTSITAPLSDKTTHAWVQSRIAIPSGPLPDSGIRTIASVDPDGDELAAGSPVAAGAMLALDEGHRPTGATGDSSGDGDAPELTAISNAKN